MTTTKRLNLAIISVAATLIIGSLLSAALSFATVRTVQTFSTLPLSDFVYQPTGRLSFKYPLGASVNYYPDGEHQKAIIEGKGYGYRDNDTLPYLDRIIINISVTSEQMFDGRLLETLKFEDNKAVTRQSLSSGNASPLKTTVYIKDNGQIYQITIDTSNQKSLAERYINEIIDSIRIGDDK